MVPNWQVADIRSALSYLETRSDVDADRLATYGSGGTGGGNAVYVAAIDSRVKCCVSYLGVSSGREWLHSMRREYEWVDYLKSIEEDRKQRALTGKGAMVSAREGGIMVQTPERQTTTIKKDVADKIPDAMPLACAEGILEYSPIDVVHKISPRGVLFIAVEGDAVTPEQQSFDLYEKALVSNDVAVLDELFRDDPRTIRYGAGEILYGHSEIKSFRSARSPVALGRKLSRTVITTFGREFAVASTLYERPTAPGKIGRQMQTRGAHMLGQNVLFEERIGLPGRPGRWGQTNGGFQEKFRL